MAQKTASEVASLSPTESAIIGLMQVGERYGTRDIYNQLKGQIKVSRSSVPVLMDRLFQLGLLKRETVQGRGGIRFLYELEKDKSAYERQVVEGVLDQMIQKFGEKAIVYFSEEINKKG